MAEREEHGAENGYGSGFDERGPVLQVGAFAGAPDVDGGDDGDHRDCYEFCGGWRKRDDFGEVAREGVRERGDGAAGDNEEERPSIEERGDAAESVANEAVEAAGFRICGGKFGVGESAEERENAADDPDEEGGSDGAVELAEDQTGSEEDAGADDGADEEEKEVARAESAVERGHAVCIVLGGKRLPERTERWIRRRCVLVASTRLGSELVCAPRPVLPEHAEA